MNAPLEPPADQDADGAREVAAKLPEAPDTEAVAASRTAPVPVEAWAVFTWEVPDSCAEEGEAAFGCPSWLPAEGRVTVADSVLAWVSLSVASWRAVRQRLSPGLVRAHGGSWWSVSREAQSPPNMYWNEE